MSFETHATRATTILEINEAPQLHPPARFEDAAPKNAARDNAAPLVSVGTQWIVDASGCDPLKLQSLDEIGDFCRSLIDSLGLHVIGEPASHRFASPHGVTMLYLLSESHLAVHTYPEHGLATFNFVCCRESADWPWEQEIRQRLGADHVSLQILRRGVWDSTITTPSNELSSTEALG